MTKKEFLKKLKRGLAPMGGYERQQALDYYDEMIDDRIESGKTEEEAVDELGSPESVVEKTLREAGIDADKSGSFFKDDKGNVKTGWVVVLIVGAPLWFGLACGLFGLALGLFCGALGLIAGIVGACVGMVAGGAASVGFGIYTLFFDFGSGLMCIGGGLTVFALGVLCSVGVWLLLKRGFGYIRSLTRKKESKR